MPSFKVILGPTYLEALDAGIEILRYSFSTVNLRLKRFQNVGLTFAATTTRSLFFFFFFFWGGGGVKQYENKQLKKMKKRISRR